MTVREVLRTVPSARLSRDSAFRICDMAFDLVEDGPPLGAEKAARIRALLEKRGLTAAQSSVHINTWVGGYGKRELVEEVVEEVFGPRERKRPEHLCYVGDSRNDGPLFAYFPRSVGAVRCANEVSVRKLARPRKPRRWSERSSIRVGWSYAPRNP